MDGKEPFFVGFGHNKLLLLRESRCGNQRRQCDCRPAYGFFGVCVEDNSFNGRGWGVELP